VRRTLRAGLVASLLVAACTGSNGQVVRSACDLLTSNEVEHATAATVLKSGPTQLMVDLTSSSNASDLTACSFDTNGPFGAVLVILQRHGIRAFDDERLRKPPPGDASARTDVSGLGDRAFTWHEGVSVVIGDTYMSISSQNETAGFSANAIELARIALTRAV
jgi:hypothetical protein